MRRFLFAAVPALLVLAVATPVHAGYLIIRIVLEGSGSVEQPGGTPVGPGPNPTPGPGVRPAFPGGEGGPGFRQPGGTGQPPIGPGGVVPGGVPSANAAQIEGSRSVVVVLPVEEDLTKAAPFYPRNANTFYNPLWQPKLHTTLHGEKIVTNLFTDSTMIQWYTTFKETPGLRKTHATDLRERHARWAKAGKTDYKVGLALVVEALSFGAAGDAQTYADDLLTAVEGKKDGVPPEVAAFARAYAAVQPGLKAGATKRAASEFWQSKLEAGTVTPSPHFAILSWDATEEEVFRRRALLEDNFKAFFLWHATRGIELKVPDAPLLVALPKQGRDVNALARALDAPPRLLADGFYSAEHGILVLSPERLDAVGQTFAAQARSTYREGVNQKGLLAGRGPDVDVTGQKGMKPDDVARMQTVALVERVADEQAAVAAISREGTLQLLYATNQLPQFVALPQWVTAGAVNFFARPRDPFFFADKDGKWWMNVSPSPGYGVPNYVLQRQLRHHYAPLIDDRRDRKEQQAERVAVLKNVLSDAYFLGLRDPKEVSDPDPVKQDKSGVGLNTGGGTGTPGGQPTGPGVGPGPGVRPPFGLGQPPVGSPAGPGVPGVIDPNAPRDDTVALLRKKREALTEKGQATAWALYYYLAKDRRDELQRFLGELAAQPRDLPLDADTVVNLFCRSLGVANTPEGLAKFTDAWFEYIKTVPPVGIDIPLVEVKPSATPMNPTGTPPTGVPPKGFPPKGNVRPVDD
ncbi:unnamed protein product [Gemmataceae bacterium]|nr:unnamed protein product [Gemmataceae bacterium]VTT98731.1 unnamed protein product [Gemmataceae bacterium]